MKNYLSEEFFDLTKQLLRKMRTTCLLIIVFASSLFATNVNSQVAKVNIALKNASVIQVIRAIENQTDYLFVYDKNEIDLTRPVDVNAENQSVAEVLNQLFGDSNVEYGVVGSNIVLMPKKTIQQQSPTVSGRVTDLSNQPLPGVTVLVKGTTTGTITDFDGNYTIADIPANGTLVFSFIGMKSQEFVVGNKTSVNVTMEEETVGIEEVVAIGYGTMKKSNLTGAISKVGNEALENRSITRAEQALQGKTAGVQIIQTSGAPGASPAIRVRGFSSNVATPPLFIVDGLRTNDIGLIDPNNIESIEVLKDASSAAIYGAEAGNGVVLITTKKGKKGEGRISYSYQMVTNELANIPKLMDASQYINYMTEGDLITSDQVNSLWDGKTDTDWADAAFETSMMKKHNLAFEGGNERGSYNLSLSYLDYDGIVKGNDDYLQKVSGMLNADYKIKDWLKVGTNNMFERWKGKSVAESNEYGSLLGAVLAMDPLTPVVYTPDNLPVFMRNLITSGNTLLTDESGNYYGLSQFFESDHINPLIIRDRVDSEGQGVNLIGTIYAELNPLKDLTFTSKLGYRVSSNGSYSFSNLFYANNVVHNDKINVSRTNSNSVYYQWENYANYSKSIGEHTFAGMAGISYSEPYSTSVTGSGNEITKNNPLFRDLNYLTPSATKGVSGGYSNTGRQFSYFGRLSYNFKEKYLFQTSLRRDASDLSVLPEGNRWGTFPAASLGYVISKENFFPKSTPIDHLKIRASWGQNGSIGPLGGYRYAATISSPGVYPYGPEIRYQVGSYPNKLENPELKWETSEQLDLGFDLLAFDSRLVFAFDYFNKKTRDLLVDVVPPYETGVGSVTVNAGNVLNKGLEFEMSWRDKIKDFNYSLSANISTLHNEVTYLDPSISRISGANFHTNQGITVFEEGYPIWYMRGYKLLDVDDETGDPIYEDQLTIDTDNDGVKDQKDGIINDNDKVMIGSAIPDFTYGLTFNASWKGLDLTLFGAGSQGNDIFLAMTRNDRPRSNGLTLYYDERWTPTNTTASKPRPNSNGVDKYWISDDVVFDGSYFRIKQIQLGYNLPQRIVNRLAMKNLRVYLSLDDWFTFTDYPGFDPESSAGATSSLGVDKGAYPISRKTTVGVNLTF
ncbi:TonB-dependent receptor [Gaoshiqia sediminis]|uniref:TonB-dependent receptor n=1 Tax=Gaoshiqia sediminis TaxID=2986998 RepID=A0AA41Y8J3_9BACT|nr:TonB-dependent receptor [Gaoshiqia sediminis]MCW0483969.1 TonB-dependent receptor [Gaoshiqia sediminis]